MTKLTAAEQYAYRTATKMFIAIGVPTPAINPRYTRTFLRNWRKGAVVTSRYTIAAHKQYRPNQPTRQTARKQGDEKLCTKF